MRYSLALICVPLLAVAAACGTGVQYADSSRFQDGIYYKGTDPVPFTPKSSDELKGRESCRISPHAVTL